MGYTVEQMEGSAVRWIVLPRYVPPAWREHHWTHQLVPVARQEPRHSDSGFHEVKPAAKADGLNALAVRSLSILL